MVALVGLWAGSLALADVAAAQSDNFSVMVSGLCPLDADKGSQVYELTGLYMIDATSRLTFGIGAGIGYADVAAYYSEAYNDVADLERRRETWTVPLLGLVRLNLGSGGGRPYLSVKAIYRFSSVDVINTDSVTNGQAADGTTTQVGNLSHKDINPFVFSLNPSVGYEFPLGWHSLTVEAGIEAVSSRYQSFSYKNLFNSSGRQTTSVIDDTAYKTKADGSYIGVRLGLAFTF